ncbi:MAG: alpha/beta hydrolase [Phenylobacterium sp.]|uniref:alpha/beta fold hydrolase n=1 Tax=Phenylobacterium sp. TaxID=1871053 RepID=UPI002724CD14|nr:alpha/beta hydrolase [Phenylobacterium sp.]MDO8912745.1 alpha/beta hydrolase [Phenylobacterium sp.]MDP3102011.1 alpha/beta hydrolase [Phenylobacterium sp.]
MTVVYFHGQPGSPAELDLVFPERREHQGRVHAPDRATDRPDLSLSAYLDHLTADVLRRLPEGQIRLVGFSLGSYVAVEVGLRLEALGRGRDLSLDLVSAAAPLDCGDFLPDMAGGAVFALARNQPRLFSALTSVQGGLSRVAPGLLFAQIFAGAAGADAQLARDPAFQTTVRGMIAHSLARGAQAYRREILGYVAQPTQRLAGLCAPITLWQGDADTWTPPAMAQAIVAIRPATLRRFPGLSHYSTLQVALPQILAGAA